MKKLSIIFRSAPIGTAAGREGLDLALLSASFEQEVSVIFVDEGVLHLAPQQQPECVDAKDYLATFKALSLYDIDTVIACQHSLTEFGLDMALSIRVTKATEQDIAQILTQADEVLVF